jgi:steroid delta-isomerase-like uncharacterized protein
MAMMVLAGFAAAQSATVQEKNQAVARAFFEEVLDQGHLERYAASHASDFVAHGLVHDANLAEDMAAAREERKALPDMRVKINQMMADADRVLVFWTASGTNTGEGLGYPPTGKAITVPGMTIFRFRQGRIVEEWSVFDMSAALLQAGLCGKP